MFQVCTQHKNRIERVCLHSECQDRALCLLCDHPHGSPFQSIMVKKSQSYKSFETMINAAIDRYFLERQQSQAQRLLAQQIQLIKNYFGQLRNQMELFIRQMEKNSLAKLMTSEEEDFMVIKRARIDKNYIRVAPRIFNVLLQVYEGLSFSDIFNNKESGKVEEVHHYLQQLHKSLSHLMEVRQCKLRLKLPDIRSIALTLKDAKPIEAWSDYDMEQTKCKFEAKCVGQSTCQFDSIISDCLRLDNMLLTTSYDKKVRLFDRGLSLRSEHQYSNLLTRIQPLSQDIYALACSKQILIQKICYDKETFSCENVMKLRGHTQRINDLHALNSRVIATSSLQGIKLWDLYKQKCEYTLKQDGNPTTLRFLPTTNQIAVGFNDHYLKIFSIETMRLIKKYELQGVPLVIDQGKFTQHCFYVGGFRSFIGVIDTRLAKLSIEMQLQTDAPTCIVDSLNDQHAVCVGDRGGSCSLLDMRTRKKRITWQAHQPKTNLSKPRGIVALFEQNQSSWITVGCNDRSLKIWQISQSQNQ